MEWLVLGRGDPIMQDQCDNPLRGSEIMKLGICVHDRLDHGTCDANFKICHL